MNPFVGAGVGKLRQPYRIREFLAEKGFSMVSVSKKVGVSHTLVRETVIGTKNNKRVLSYLQDLGCPEEFLSMPQKKE